jgi:nitrite reductase/ring-hydroxylating ferredoxin subunit
MLTVGRLTARTVVAHARRQSACASARRIGRKSMAEYMAGNVDDYADGDRKVVVCGDKEVGVFRIGDEFYAWHNRCAHRAGPVCQGRIMKRVLEPVASDKTTRTQEYDEADSHIVCPWHGYEFSIKTGFHQGSGQFRLLKAELTISDGEIYVSA